MSYQRADFAPLRETGYGIGFHWTTWTCPRTGERKPFPQAVAEFDVAAFVAQAREAGAGHVLFTATHLLHWLPAPNPEVDRILPGRTCRRDLLMELADGLTAAGIRFILYYNHGACSSNNDPEWAQASGARSADRTRYYENYCRILGWMGERYGRKAIALWVDGGSTFAGWGGAPWAQMAAAAKAGNRDRLVCYNPGIERFDLYTECQDYWAGEVTHLEFAPSGDLTPAGLPWYSFTALHRAPKLRLSGQWGIDEEVRRLDWPVRDVELVAAYLRRFHACRGTVTFNLLCYQDGSVHESDLELMRQLRQVMRGETV